MKKNRFLSKINIRVMLLAVLCCVLWGSISPVIKVSYELFHLSDQNIPDLTVFAGIRYILCGLVGIAYGTLRRGRPLTPNGSSWGILIKLAIVQTVIQQLCFYISLTHMTGTNASILGSLNYFFSVLIACLIFHQEKLTARKLIGCVFGFTGVIVINLTQGSLGTSISIMGEGMMLGACISCGAAYAMLREYGPREDALVLNAYQFLIGGITLYVIGKLTGGQFYGSTPGGYALFTYMVVMPITAFTIWGTLLKTNEVSSLSVFGFVNPIAGVMFSAILLSEKGSISPVRCLTSLMLVCVGIYTVNGQSGVKNSPQQ